MQEHLGTSARGLDDAEAGARLDVHGPNVLPTSKGRGLARIVAAQFVSPLIAILAAAGVFAAAIGELIDAAFIAGVLVLNAAIGAVQEWRAERGAQALQKMLRVTAIVERAGVRRALDAKDVVPGDIVHLESGQSVPADVRLTWTHALEVDESLLTGESVPVAKSPEPLANPQPLADRINMAHAGSWVARGRGRGVVVATGIRTEVGRIATDLQRRHHAPAPLIARMRRFARTVGIVVLIAAALLAVLGLLRGEPLRDMALFAVAIAVAVVPEGLPIALTVALAVGTARMARRRVIVRRLAAVEGLGSCTLIATDKTGTLTMNALTVRRVTTTRATYDVTGEGYAPSGDLRQDGGIIDVRKDAELTELLRAAALCNEGSLYRQDGRWQHQGDPTDVALLALAGKAGLGLDGLADAHPMRQIIPFEAERRYAATVHDDGTMYVKGAPEAVLPMCAGGDGAAVEAMTRDGLRVLAIAKGTASPDRAPGEPSGLHLLGFVGMMDPPRPGVPESIRAAQDAGLRVVMITGDHPATATRIAEAVGIDAGVVVTGDMIASMPVHELATRIHDVAVFARVAPHQKLLIVKAAQEAGHFVAVTGDGVNDAPALRAANVGVAMGQDGTDVAREAADIVLADDAFPSIVAGVEEGRIAYNNVRNVVFLLVATGAAELLLMVLALITGSPLPLLPAQLLWLNLVTNGIQDVGLGMEPGTGDELAQCPRHPKERIFDRMMIERTLLSAAVMGGGGFLVFTWLLAEGWSEPAARNALLLLLVLFENLHVGNCRSETRSAFSLNPLRNPFLLWGVVVSQALHLATLYFPPMRAVLRTEPVTWTTWWTLLAIAGSIVVIFELHKAIRRRFPVRRLAFNPV